MPSNFGRQRFERQGVDPAFCAQAKQVRGIQFLVALLPVQQAEIGFDGRRRERIVTELRLPHDLLRSLGELAKFWRRRPVTVGGCEHTYLALVGRSFAVAVAAPRGLGDGVQARFCAIDSGQGNIDTGFDQRRRNKPARLAGLEARPHPGQDLATVLGAHQRSQVARTGQVGERLIHRTGVAAVIDDAQHLVEGAELSHEFIVIERADMAHTDPVQLAEELWRIRGEFAHLLQPTSKILCIQRRLSGGTEHHTINPAIK